MEKFLDVSSVAQQFEDAWARSKYDRETIREAITMFSYLADWFSVTMCRSMMTNACWELHEKKGFRSIVLNHNRKGPGEKMLIASPEWNGIIHFLPLLFHEMDMLRYAVQRSRPVRLGETGPLDLTRFFCENDGVSLRERLFVFESDTVPKRRLRLRDISSAAMAKEFRLIAEEIRDQDA